MLESGRDCLICSTVTVLYVAQEEVGRGERVRHARGDACHVTKCFYLIVSESQLHHKIVTVNNQLTFLCKIVNNQHILMCHISSTASACGTLADTPASRVFDQRGNLVKVLPFPLSCHTPAHACPRFMGARGGRGVGGSGTRHASGDAYGKNKDPHPHTQKLSRKF